MALRDKTKYTGVYTRTSKTKRYLGKADVCFEITYKVGPKLIWEKVGWKSEGYTAVLASEIRAERIRVSRHPDQFPSPPKADPLTYGRAWEIFAEKRLPLLKNHKALRHHYAIHIQPVFENVLLKDITSFSLESFKVALLSKEAIRKTKTGKVLPRGNTLSPSTVNFILLDVLNVIGRMIEWGLHPGPAPKVKLLPSNNERQRFLTPIELERLLDVLEILSCRVYRIALISMHTGMRVGEVLRMRGQDVDFENRLIHVDGKMGKRAAFMDDTVINVLQSIVPVRPADLVFTTAKGLQIRPNALTHTFTKAVNILGLNDGITDPRFKVVIHTLRHTFCSWLASQNVPLYTIGKLVGHTSLRSTQRYAKLSPDAKWDALKLIEKIASSAHTS
ncbi:MAG: site-specific integrase [Bilophila sp.]|uniref:tyrosine-type recombinase/integrase n=1 Tax=Bilophila sp. TaxID=1929485 RepID=UPI00257BCEC1|nr:site-specific integrase [Bilophila sp.]MBS5455012.1 site-specific integrase [Bilophila sp.]